MKPSVLIVEDSQATRERLEVAIDEGGKFRLNGSVGTFKAAEAILEASSPDILLTDIGLPDGSGVDLIKMLKQPNVKTELAIVITVFGDEDHVVRALKAGASGYLLKDDDFIEINNAMIQMMEGGSPISPSIARYLLQEFSVEPRQETPNEILSKRECEILVEVSLGFTSKEIGKKINLSHHTINAHVKNIYKKLSVRNKTEAIYKATKKGII